jgi:pilus assembly protein FimV
MLFSKHLMTTGGAVGKPFSRAVLAASVALAFSSASYAAGLGRLNVLSDLGQPLRAEIDVVAVEKGELDSLNAKLGSIDTYLQNNLPYPPPSLGLKLSLEKRASGSPYVIATTAQPVNEPFVDILVELTWNGGRILRAYTALLDPPSYAAEEQPAAPVVVPPAAAEAPPAAPATPAEPAVETQLGSEFQKAPEPQPEPTQAEPTAEAPAAPAPATEAGAAPAPAAGEMPMPAEAGMPKAAAPSPAQQREHTVKRGDTLSKIAKEYKPDEVSLEQMLVLLYRTNPDAFAGKNMNRLKTGKVVQVPDASEASAIDLKEARREVRLQAADFNAYKEKLAEAAAMGEAAGTPSGQSAGGAVSPMVSEKSPAPEAQPKEVLKLSKGDAAGGAGASQARIRSLEEEVAAREKTIKEQTERVAKLEKQVKDMQVLLELKNKGMADLQKQAAAPAPSVPTPAAAPTKESKPGAAHGTEHQPAQAAVPSESKPESKPAPAPMDTQPAPATTTAAEPVAGGPAAQSGTRPSAAAAGAKKPRAKAVKAASEPSLMDQLMNPMYLGGGAAVLALLGFLGFRSMKKRKASSFEDIEVAEKKNSDVAPLTSTDSTGAMAAAARAVAAGAPVTEEVDPLAEAEIYLAYGRDGQAEEILKEALQTSPRRQEIQIKLLEIYAKRKDAGAFDTIARDLQVSTGGQGELWLQAARMGYQIDPQNPRYVAGRTSGEEPPPAIPVAAPGVLDEKIDFNIGLDDTDTGTKTDIDLTRLGGGGGTSTDIDLSNLGASGAAPEINLSTISGVPERTTEVDLDIGGAPEPAAKGSGLDFDFDLNALGAASPPAQENTQTLTKAMSQTVADVGEPGLGTIEFDLSRIALDTGGMGKQEPTMGADAGVPELDLSGINLDLDGEPGTASGATSGAAARDDHWYDVQTKFDLAKAYQEMGDKEGAREILREVIAEGDGEQQAAAQRVLETLA